MIQARLEGKTIKEAAREVGYSESTVKSKIYQLLDTPEYHAEIQRQIEQAALDTREVIGTTVGQMRMDIADLFPDDEFLQRARALKISRNIKKVRRHITLVGFDQEGNPLYQPELEVEVYSSQEAIKILNKNFGMEQMAAPNEKRQRDFETQLLE